MSRLKRIEHKGLVMALQGLVLALIVIAMVTQWAGTRASTERATSKSREEIRKKYEALAAKGDISLHEAMYYTKEANEEVQCALCPWRCRLKPGERGICRVRVNIGGMLYSLVYGIPVAVHLDPIEKKPLYHVQPGTYIFSFATIGCPLACKYCQNWTISQASPGEDMPHYPAVSPEALVQGAKSNGSRAIAYTYTEPVIFYEFMLDTAKEARRQGLRNVAVTSGYINPEPLRELCPYLDAANVDLKGFSEEFYQRMYEGSLQPVLDALKIMREEGVWIEITNLVIPGQNDDPEMIREMCRWIRKELGDYTPVFFSRFSPNHKLRGLPPTPITTLEMASSIARKEGLKFVYLGNYPGHPEDNTYCPNCGKPLIMRSGYRITEFNIHDGQCKYCGEKIPGLWSERWPDEDDPVRGTWLAAE